MVVDYASAVLRNSSRASAKAALAVSFTQWFAEKFKTCFRISERHKYVYRRSRVAHIFYDGGVATREGNPLVISSYVCQSKFKLRHAWFIRVLAKSYGQNASRLK